MAHSYPSRSSMVCACKARQIGRTSRIAGLADYDLVFSTSVGTPPIVRNVVRDFKHVLKRAGMLLKIASRRLGHSGIAITGDLYQHFAQDMGTNAAERAAKVMRAP